MLIDLIFKGEKATYELGQGLSAFIIALGKGLAAGHPFENLLVIGKAALADIVPVIKNITEVDDDFAENKVAFMNSWIKTGEDVFEGLVALKAEVKTAQILSVDSVFGVPA